MGIDPSIIDLPTTATYCFGVLELVFYHLERLLPEKQHFEFFPP
jgi:hypothetical protein